MNKTEKKKPQEESKQIGIKTNLMDRERMKVRKAKKLFI